jgi:hypothetical protein
VIDRTPGTDAAGRLWPVDVTAQGGPAEKIAGDAPWSLAIAVDDQAVYFTNYMAGTLLKLAK